MTRYLVIARNVIASFLALGILMTAVPETHAATAATVTALRNQAKSGRISLATIPYFRGTPFADLVLTGASVDRQGSCLGKVTWGTTAASALLQRIAPKTGLPYYICVLGTPGRTIASHIPGFAGTPADQIDLQSPLLAFATQETSVGSDDLTPQVKAYWAKMYRGDFSIRVNKGVTFLGAASARPGTAVAKVMSRLGVGSAQLQLEGVLLNDFDASALKAARKEGKLKVALRSGLVLRATLAGLAVSLKGLPKGAKVGDPFLEITGTPSLAVGFNLEVPNNGTVHKFSASCRVSKGDTGIDLTFNAASASTFSNAFGIPGFDLERVALQLGVDSRSNVTLGLAGDFAVGERKGGAAGKVKINAVTGVPTDVALRGKLSRVGLRDLVALANKIGRKASPGSRPLSADALPDVEMREVDFTYAPLGGDPDLNIGKGLACKGQMWVGGSLFAHVDAYVDASGKLPLVSIKAQSKDVNLLAIQLRNATVDVLIAPSLDAHFKVSGSLTVLASTKTVAADVSKDRVFLRYVDRLDGVYEATMEFSSPSRTPFWTLSARARIDLMRTLETKVAGEIAAARRKAQADLASANATLNRHLVSKREAEQRLASARAIAQRDYQNHLRDVSAAEAKVRAARDKVVAEERKLQPLKSQFDAAYREYQNAPWYRKADTWAKQAGLRGAYETALGALRAAQGTLHAAEATTREGGKAAGWLALGPESHPEVIKARAEVALKNEGIKAAQKLVDAGNATATATTQAAEWMARNAGKVFTVDEVALTVRVGGRVDSLKDSTGDLYVKYRWMGKDKSYTGRLAVKDFGPDVIKDRLLAALDIR